MVRLKFIKSYKAYRVGDVVRLSPESAEPYIKAGAAIITKDMVKDDMQTKDAS